MKLDEFFEFKQNFFFEDGQNWRTNILNNPSVYTIIGLSIAFLSLNSTWNRKWQWRCGCEGEVFIHVSFDKVNKKTFQEISPCVWFLYFPEDLF